MNWKDFAVTWAGMFRPFQPRDTVFMKSLLELVKATPESVMEAALPEFAERYNSVREAGGNPSFPTRWQLENAIRKHTPRQRTECSFCGGSGHVQCVVTRRHEPVAPHSAEPGSNLYLEMFNCPCCRSAAYRSPALLEAVKVCCRPEGSVSGTDMLLEAFREVPQPDTVS